MALLDLLFNFLTNPHNGASPPKPSQAASVSSSRTISSVVVALFGLFCFTYFATWMQFMFRVRIKKIGGNPPIVPYFIPWLGNAVRIARDIGGGIDDLIARYDKYSVPLGLRLGPLQASFLTRPEQFTQVFSSRNASQKLSPKPGMMIAMKNMFGTPKDALRIYRKTSAVARPPGPGKDEEHIFHHMHAAAHKYLTGVSVRLMTQRFMEKLSRSVELDEVGRDGWEELPDVFQFWQSHIFNAAVYSLFGPHFLALNPDLNRDFWQYMDAMPTLFAGAPRTLAPQAHAARQRVIDSICKWHRFAAQHEDYSDNGPDAPDWEPYWGAKYMKARQQIIRRIDGMDDAAAASEDLSILVATNANSIVAAAWMLFEICADEGLCGRVEADLVGARGPEANRREMDIGRLCESPILQSVYAEVLRMRMAVIVTRTPLEGDYQAGNWVFPAGRLIVASSATAGSRPDAWAGHTDEGRYGLDGFWADRFLVNREGEQTKVFSLDGLSGAWIPYGGGPFMCPGRHFAKQEILASAAIFLDQYETRINQKGIPWPPRADKRFYGFGVLPSRDKISCQVRKKNGHKGRD